MGGEWGSGGHPDLNVGTAWGWVHGDSPELHMVSSPRAAAQSAGVGALAPKSSAPSAWALGRLGMVCCVTPQLPITSTPRWR